jgi:hypothetical protein
MLHDLLGPAHPLSVRVLEKKEALDRLLKSAPLPPAPAPNLEAATDSDVLSSSATDTAVPDAVPPTNWRFLLSFVLASLAAISAAHLLRSAN